jgi:hypothetical protein
MSILPDSTHRLFEEPKDVTIITIDADGSPQASLVWVERDGDDLLIGLQAAHRKTRNLFRDPRVTLLIQDDQVSSRGISSTWSSAARRSSRVPGFRPVTRR